MKNGKNGKLHVLTLQNIEQDGLHYDLAADSLEELFEWYKVAWGITQREMRKQFSREQEASVCFRNIQIGTVRLFVLLITVLLYYYH